MNREEVAIALLKRFVTARIRSCYDISNEEMEAQEEAERFVGGCFCQACGAWRETEEEPHTCEEE